VAATGHGTDAATSSPTTKPGDQTMSFKINVPVQIIAPTQTAVAIAEGNIIGSSEAEANNNLFINAAQQSAFTHQFVL